MSKIDNSTPVLILSCKLGGLAILRSLGRLGIECWGIDEDPHCPGFLSRYSRGKRIVGRYDDRRPAEYIDLVLCAGERIGRRPILIPTSDELVMLVARFQERLGERFRFPKQDPEQVERLAGKLDMNALARAHGVAVPETHLPLDERDMLAALPRFRFPLMLKPCFGSGQNTDPLQQMVLVHDEDELRAEYRRRENPNRPNMMLQEHIPGGDDQVYIFDGYFDADSRCRAAFTGRKIRQYPVHRGCASLGEQSSCEPVAGQMVRFLEAIGYRGIVDAGMRLDPRDGTFKLLDVNPRIGQAFRLFLAEDGTDVARCLYLDMTGQPFEVPPQREGRRWMIEDYDVISSFDYAGEGSLTFSDWLGSFRGLEEAAWWSWRDPRPFLSVGRRLAGRAFRAAVRRLRQRVSAPGSGGAFPKPLPQETKGPELE